MSEEGAGPPTIPAARYASRYFVSTSTDAAEHVAMAYMFAVFAVPAIACAILVPSWPRLACISVAGGLTAASLFHLRYLPEALGDLAALLRALRRPAEADGGTLSPAMLEARSVEALDAAWAQLSGRLMSHSEDSGSRRHPMAGAAVPSRPYRPRRWIAIASVVVPIVVMTPIIGAMWLDGTPKSVLLVLFGPLLPPFAWYGLFKSLRTLLEARRFDAAEALWRRRRATLPFRSPAAAAEDDAAGKHLADSIAELDEEWSARRAALYSSAWPPTILSVSLVGLSVLLMIAEVATDAGLITVPVGRQAAIEWGIPVLMWSAIVVIVVTMSRTSTAIERGYTAYRERRDKMVEVLVRHRADAP